MPIRMLVLISWIVMIPVGVHAEILFLKNGTAINAKILEQDKKKMKVEFNGQTVTYYMDEIQSVNGKPLTDPVTPPAQSGAVSVPSNSKVSNLMDHSQITSKRELIKKFIDVFGTRENMSQNFERMLISMPPKKSEEIRKILNVDEVIDNLVPLYDKYFTQEELESYIAFYSSAQGQKFLKAIPQIMKESVDVNIDYFKKKLPQDAQ